MLLSIKCANRVTIIQTWALTLTTAEHIFAKLFLFLHGLFYNLQWAYIVDVDILDLYKIVYVEIFEYFSLNLSLLALNLFPSQSTIISNLSFIVAKTLTHSKF